MCGLVAIVRPNGLTDDERAGLVDEMRDTLAHRGPDDATSAIVDDWVALGHRRLSIIDAEGSRQPLVNENGQVLCVFNGEIYNFASLRARLTALGHRFATRGDGEVIVHGYEQWGERVAEELEGMFAFVLVDRRARRVVAARDRFGIKPLFWTRQRGAVLLASELKALMSHPSVPRVASRLGLELGMMRAHVPWPLTAFEGVYRLPPGVLLTVDETGEPQLRRFAPMVRGARAPRRPLDELVDETEEEVSRAVERQMVADVPVGAFLSGGIDSTLIVTLMSRLAGTRLHTFSVSVGAGDESAAARQTAERLGTEHHVIELGELPFEDLEVLATLYDEPFAETSAIGVRALSRAARRHVAVVLTGDGGDEVFGGYDTYRYIRNIARIGEAMPTRLARPLRALATGQLHDRAWPRPLRRGLRALSIVGESPRAAQRALARQEPFLVVNQTLLDSALLTARIEAAAATAIDELGAARQAMIADRLERLPGAMLTKVDVASMSASLEVRVPLLDDALVRLADRLDEDALVGWFRGKRILRRVLDRLLPGQLASAPKRGFSMPTERWLRRRDCERRLHELFRDEQQRLIDLTGCDALERASTFYAAPPDAPSNATPDELLWLASVAWWARSFGVTRAERHDPASYPLA